MRVIPFVSKGDLQLEDPLYAVPFIMRLHAKYGDNFQFQAPFGHSYIVSQPELVHQILQRVSFSRYTVLKLPLGNGLVSSSGDYWAGQRRLMQPSFKKRRIAQFISLITDATKALTDRWTRLAQSGETVEIASEMSRLTLEIISRAMFSVSTVDKAVKIGRALTEIIEDLAYLAAAGYGFPLMVAPERNRRFQNSLKVVDDIAYDMIRERRVIDRQPDDLLGLLLEASDPTTGELLNDRQIRDEVVTMLLAGHETTANMLAWTWYVLSQHPETVQQIRAESYRIIEGSPTMYDCMRLAHTQRVLRESMRLYPPVWLQGRSPDRAEAIDGYEFRSGATIILISYVTHHDPQHWEEPERFDPARFFPEQVAARAKGSYFPFGGGRHVCIGESLAILEGSLILATLLKRFDVQPLPEHKPELQTTVTLRPHNGLPARIHFADALAVAAPT